MPVNPTTGQELQNAEQTDNFLKLDESLRENRHTFAPESLQYCSRKHCTLVPKFTALHFPEITVFLFPVYRRVLRMRGAMPTEESVIVLMAKTAMDKKAYFRALPGIERDKVLFPDDSGNFLDLLNN